MDSVDLRLGVFVSGMTLARVSPVRGFRGFLSWVGVVRTMLVTPGGGQGSLRCHAVVSFHVPSTQVDGD
jgi:hypothetical protein